MGSIAAKIASEFGNDCSARGGLALDPGIALTPPVNTKRELKMGGKITAVVVSADGSAVLFTDHNECKTKNWSLKRFHKFTAGHHNNKARIPPDEIDHFCDLMNPPTERTDSLADMYDLPD